MNRPEYLEPELKHLKILSDHIVRLYEAKFTAESKLVSTYSVDSDIKNLNEQFKSMMNEVHEGAKNGVMYMPTKTEIAEEMSQ